MKKKSLTELKVTSFVTSLDSSKSLNGGLSGNTDFLVCGATKQDCNNSDLTCVFPTNDGCNNHTAGNHNCSNGYCYSDLCHSKECGGPASDVCPV